ncbi:hypothetical protein [uncultured Ruegeria sp.]|uniref:phosphotriesterase family protein n=1 Tax=uncultured Ruegeria sp. TaxID=259304 RepID=UPI0026276596|nr:hypothetical protein [uncultured Ruegeria sp.]
MTTYNKSRREFLELAAGVGAAALTASATPVLAASDPANGTVMTVRGPVPAKDLGFTLMHEHIYSDFTGYYYETKPDFDKIDKVKYFAADPEEPVQMKHLGYMNMGGYAFMRDAWSLRDRQVMIDELNYYKQVGGQTILEVSPWGKNQGPEYHLVLKDLSEQTGVNLICSTGLYGGDGTFWYDEALEMSTDELTKTFLGHVNEGFGTSGVKAGHLKTAPNYWDENEQRAAQAIINAQKECGLPYTIHHGSKFDQPKAEEVHRDLKTMGATPERTVFAHMQSFVTNDNLRNQVTNPEGRFVVDLDFFKGILDQGYTLSFDTFGTWVGFEIFEFLLDGDVPNAFEGNGGQSDVEVMAMVYFLVQQGYSKQIVLSQDCYAKNHLRTFGGVGYTRISNYVVPLLRNVGVGEDAISDMVVNTPARMLSKI